MKQKCKGICSGKIIVEGEVYTLNPALLLIGFRMCFGIDFTLYLE